MPNKNSQFTALTANIEMGGVKIGGLQSLTVDENWNMTRVGEIGSAVDIVHVPGRYQVNLTARRMFIERDLFMSAISPVSGTAGAETPQTDITTNSVAVATSDMVTDISAADAALTRGEKILHYSFDVAVSDANGIVVFTAHDCSITSRRRTLDQGAIIVAEDVNMIAKYVSLGAGITSSFNNIAQ